MIDPTDTIDLTDTVDLTDVTNLIVGPDCIFKFEESAHSAFWIMQNL